MKQLLDKIEHCHFDEVVDIALNIEQELGLPYTDAAMASWSVIEEGIRAALLERSQTEQQISMLLDYFYTEALFSEQLNPSLITEQAFVSSVLQYRTGLPITLGTILLTLAYRLGFDVVPVFVPGEMLLKFNLDNDRSVFVSPATGNTLGLEEIQHYASKIPGAEELSPLDEVHPETITDDPTDVMKKQSWHEASARDVVLLYLSQLKALLVANNKLEQGFNIVEILLGLQPDDPYERRDRGLMLQKMHCHKVAKQDLDFFVEHCPDDPATEIIKKQAEGLEHQHITLH